MDEQDYIAFEDYLSKKLSKEEVAIFEQKVNTDNAFAEGLKGLLKLGWFFETMEMEF